MEYFVAPGSVVRKIWGRADTILFIFAGASAEFALNKAVDWLYFTGRLPADPLGRLFSTVNYARMIVFSETGQANRAIDKMTLIHSEVEAKRGTSIPQWAYQDVLFMLIDYSIRSFELLDRRLSEEEKTEVFKVFRKVGDKMHLHDLPLNFSEWQLLREEHLNQDLEKTDYTVDLYKQYRKHLGSLRFWLLKQAQILVVPEQVNKWLKLGSISLLTPVLPVYKFSRLLKMEWVLKSLILPKEYKAEIKALDIKQLEFKDRAD